jgi:hypothetical protein
MPNQILKLADCRFELLTRDDAFLGLGRVWIGDTLVRSGRLPLTVSTTSYTGHDLAGLTLLGVKKSAKEVRVRLRASFRPAATKLMRDHSFDPIHDTGDWDAAPESGSGELDVVLRPARDSYNGVAASGFSYHYEYRSRQVPLFYLLDKASWELDGDIAGATAVSQSSCSAPVVTFAADTAWSTEGILFFLVEQGNANPVMTHNLPRWASHQAFDYQHKGGRTLLGVFQRVELIRTILQRDVGRPELKCFDKHLFDQSGQVATSPKQILLAEGTRGAVGQQNLWTWVLDEVHARARAEFGLQAEPVLPRLSQNYWHNFTADSYYRDLVPAAIATGVKLIFVDNLRKSAMTERAPLPGVFNWNMCCGHEYEISDKLGGNVAVKRLVDECARHGIIVQSWTNNDQALSSPINKTERDDQGWFVLLEDARQKYGGAYACVMSVLDLGVAGARQYFIESHAKIREETGLNWYLFDSFYNLGFMPISYRNCQPRTIWRGLLQTVKALQERDVHFSIESFGPFGAPQHGHPSSYNFETVFACYQVGVGNDYSTVPTAAGLKDLNPRGADGLYYLLAHMACLGIPLHQDGKRIDLTWTPAHRQALDDYHARLPKLSRRYLQEDGLAVLWHDAAGQEATLFNFRARQVALPGKVVDLATGKALPRTKRYRLEANRTYTITAAPLPTTVG